jgi:hypothetical protein
MIAGHRVMSGRSGRLCNAVLRRQVVYVLQVWVITAPLARQFPASGRVSDDCAALA